jgi:hypothetical protein
MHCILSRRIESERKENLIVPPAASFALTNCLSGLGNDFHATIDFGCIFPLIDRLLPLRIIACIEDAEVIENILQHLGLGGAPEAEHLARAGPEAAGLFD